MEREWTTVRDDPNYEVTRSGSVRNSKTGNVLKPSLNNSGYLFVNMGPKHHRFSRSVHRLVAEGSISMVANGKRESYKGHHIQYIYE